MIIRCVFLQAPKPFEIRKLKDMRPASVKLVVCKEGIWKHRETVPSNGPLAVTIEEEFKIFAVQILDVKNNPTCCKPFVSSRHHYDVQLILRETMRIEEGDKPVDRTKETGIGTTDRVYKYVQKNHLNLTNSSSHGSDKSDDGDWKLISGKDLQVRSNVADGYYWFEKIKFGSSVSATLIVRVLDSNVMGEPRTLLEQPFPLILKQIPIKTITVQTSFGNDLFPCGFDWSKSELGLLFHFLDERNNRVVITDTIKVTVKAVEEAGMKFVWSTKEDEAIFLVC